MKWGKSLHFYFKLKRGFCVLGKYELSWWYRFMSRDISFFFKAVNVPGDLNHFVFFLYFFCCQFLFKYLFWLFFPFSFSLKNLSFYFFSYPSLSLSLSLFLSPSLSLSLFLFIALSATLIILFSIIIYNKTMSFSIKSYCYNRVTMILFISLSPWHHLPSVQSNCCNISIDKRSSSRALNNACDIRENACGRPEIEACVTKVVTTRCRSTKGV